MRPRRHLHKPLCEQIHRFQWCDGTGIRRELKRQARRRFRRRGKRDPENAPRCYRFTGWLD